MEPYPALRDVLRVYNYAGAAIVPIQLRDANGPATVRGERRIVTQSRRMARGERKRMDNILTSRVPPIHISFPLRTTPQVTVSVQRRFVPEAEDNPLQI